MIQVRTTAILVPLAFVLIVRAAAAEPPGTDKPANSEAITIRTGLAINLVGKSGRSLVHTDAIEAQLVNGTFAPPKGNDTLTLPDGSTRKWEAITADQSGVFKHKLLIRGYLHTTVDVPQDKVMLLKAKGHSIVYINGNPRPGDFYGTGWMNLPIPLKQGTNHLLFRCPRGQLQAALTPIVAPAFIDASDTTLPDLIHGESEPQWASVVVINASTNHLTDAMLSASLGEKRSIDSSLPPIPRLSTRKVGFRIPPAIKKDAGKLTLHLTLSTSQRAIASPDPITLTVHAYDRNKPHRRTFISDIDGSVQYYAVNPADSPTAAHGDRVLFLSLHGANVEAIGQAKAYSAKSWGNIICPTNRRPFGFDWEDWGRLDALEVLQLAIDDFQPDPSRIYLTGHSMGGHGAWQIGVHYPDRFAAIGPSAGWASFWSYANKQKPETLNGIAGILHRASSASDTMALSSNYKNLGVYILHGADDDNVPASEARNMLDSLSEFHHDLVYHEQPAAGHWWDDSDEPGAACVDWPPMFDFFARHARPLTNAVRRIEFTTASPGVSPSCHWATIEMQTKQFMPSSVDLRIDPHKRRFVGKTNNIRRLSLDLAGLSPDATLTALLDRQELKDLAFPAGSSPHLWLSQEEGKWKVIPKPTPQLKGPHRYGQFKDAFRNRVCFVYATGGTKAENDWALAKAVFDAESFRYRGNGSIDVISDQSFLDHPDTTRNVILYGHSQCNLAWHKLLPDCPVLIKRNAAIIGKRTFEGGNLASAFIYPMPGAPKASVGVIGGTGLAGMRLTNSLPVFVSGVGFPDLLLVGTDMLEKGISGIKAAGFFGEDWSLRKGEFAFHPEDRQE